MFTTTTYSWIHLGSGASPATSAAPRRDTGFSCGTCDAHLAAAPIAHAVPDETFAGRPRLAAGDGGLLAVLPTWSDEGGLRLFYLRTDLLGRKVGDVRPLDFGCSDGNANCGVLGFNVVWTGTEFLIVYLFTPDAFVETPVVEMRTLRLAAAS